MCNPVKSQPCKASFVKVFKQLFSSLTPQTLKLLFRLPSRFLPNKLNPISLPKYIYLLWKLVLKDTLGNYPHTAVLKLVTSYPCLLPMSTKSFELNILPAEYVVSFQRYWPRTEKNAPPAVRNKCLSTQSIWHRRDLV